MQFDCGEHLDCVERRLELHVSPRTLRKGSEVLQYNLYRNAARTTIWGDGTGGTSVYSLANPPNNSNVNLTIYGRIPAQQDVSAGNYSDTVSAVINF